MHLRKMCFSSAHLQGSSIKEAQTDVALSEKSVKSVGDLCNADLLENWMDGSTECSVDEVTGG